MPVSVSNTWATMASKNTKTSKIPTKQEKETDLKTQPPTSQILNEFKPATLVICTPPKFKDLDNLSANTVTDTINGILKNMGAFGNTGNQMSTVKRFKNLHLYLI
ncbi:hypothetical protein O181_021053 [Austropuccinia psidii MF-1]|uniref:Uncharacterized protein n=1 Tax=Austropuccinia psidii MF-1 TaxID=1389203 RepID=A0A9Q3CCL2_9BASI|nr:hypothetical protein [Austropuccinia psidii MF-1]